MRTAVLLVSLITLAYSASEETLSGYKGIQFGWTKTKIKQYLTDSLNIIDSENSFVYSENEFGDQGDRICFLKIFDKDSENTVVVNVSLLFTPDTVFFSQELATNKYTANYFNTLLKDDALFISSIFKEKYGAPTDKVAPSILNVRHGYVSYFWKWANKTYDIYTGFSVSNSEYYATAVLTDKNLAAKNERSLKIIRDTQAKAAAEGF